MAKSLGLILLLVALPLGAATFSPLSAPVTTDNDDSCDIGLYPAATLLLPYFEVTLGSTNGQSTLLTVTNTSAQPQIARVTLWTDYSFPVISFNLYLTGYDVQKINLFDIIGRGLIAPDSPDMGSDGSPVGELSDEDNPRIEADSCTDLPRVLPNFYIQRMQSAFTLGRIPQLGSLPACETAGGTHQNAIGYATIDVVGACTGTVPTERGYFTNEIRFDNVLMGDSIQIDPAQDYAQGNPMVHIRAIPEGGETSNRRATHLAKTFYSRLQPSSNRTLDARQPLPSTFGARWIAGGVSGFQTFYKIWRESNANPDTACSAYPKESNQKFEAVRFDEEENPEVYAPPLLILPVVFTPVLPSTSLVDTSREQFPPAAGADVAGWMYLNLHNPDKANEATQNWVTVSMRAENRFSGDMDATAFGNGCSPAAATSKSYGGTGIIGPAPNSN